MRWKTNKPKDGDERIVRCFAFLPTEVDTGETVWLEWLWATETYYDDRSQCTVGRWMTKSISIDYPKIKEAHNGTN